MMKEKVFYNPIDGTGSLTISWSSEPKGDAVEAKRGNGVGFFSKSGDLLAVIFDEVESKKDHQILEFDHNRVEISVKSEEITYTVSYIRKVIPKLRRRRSRQHT